MLVLTLRPGQKIHVGNAVVMVTRVTRRNVRLGIEAPREIEVDREEIRRRKLKQRGAA